METPIAKDDATMSAADDYFIHVPLHRVAVCRTCHFAVFPDQAWSHLRAKHPGLSASDRRRIADGLATWSDLSQSSDESFVLPKAVNEPIAGLRVVKKGLQCTLQPAECTYVGIAMATLTKHWRESHSWGRGEGQRGRPTGEKSRTIQQRQADACVPVHCQRFFHHGKHAGYFAVLHTSNLESNSDQQERQTEAPTGLLTDAVLRSLAVLEERQGQCSLVVPDTSSAKEVSPWLQMTRWPMYLSGCDMRLTAALIAQPRQGSEVALHAICESVDRLVDDAFHSVCSDAINVFDQTRINSFLQRPRAADRPLLVKLQKSTWRQYIKVWKALLCFTYRTQEPGQLVLLCHRLTSRQLSDLDETVGQANKMTRLKATGRPASEQAIAVLEQQTEAMDRACLDLCISLLDHDLRGNLFESVVVGFFAVLGIDVGKGILKEAYHYTPYLSGFIKIAQMLAIQKAVVAAREGIVTQPADLLDEMRVRFMIHGTRSPFSWASRLRIYGKKVRDSTTCLGYISWSDDGKLLSYKGVRHLSIEAFRDFVRDQVVKAQAELEGLLLLHPTEHREELGIEFWMHRIVDNPTENARDWSFLQHPQNSNGTLPCRENWLLERVLENKWLQEEFICSKSSAEQVQWRQKAVKDYKKQLDAFLERLLLLVHLTSGQPARGTELLSLRYINTVNGSHRNLFIDNGMVSTVTTYHKGYSTTGSTKIIHRYLPKEVGELLVYYLWLVRPFYRKLELLSLRKTDRPSPFLWAKEESIEPWGSSKLSAVLQRETMLAFGVAFNIPVYRHLAIAISRKHLAGSGFKRDYGPENLDTQATHTPWTAGRIYARGLEEAPGHVQTRRAEYRKISQEWHRFLGFLPSTLPSRKRPLSDITNHYDTVSKRVKGAPAPFQKLQLQQDEVWEF
jgi:hypothetical protein